MPTILDERTQYQDTAGKPLVGGSVAFGVQGADPDISPQAIFSDRDFATAIANPQILDANGQTTNKVYIKDRYSIVVKDINSVQVYSELDNGEPGSVGVVTLDNVVGANTIAATASPTITAYVDRETYVFKTASINTSAVTLDIDGVGAKSVTLSDGGALVSGLWAANQNIKVIYNLTSDTFVFEQFRELTQAEVEAGTAVIPGVVSAARLKALGAMPRAHLAGIGISNAADGDHDITFAVGEARDSTNAADLVLAAAQTKQIDATWATGDAAGGLASGATLAINTWYYCFVGLVGSTVECGFDTSIIAANLVANNAWTSFRRVGSVLTDGSSNIIAFVQDGDEILWDAPVEDLDSAAIGTTATLVTHTVPVGLIVRAIVNGYISHGTGAGVWVSSPNVTDAAASESVAPGSTLAVNNGVQANSFTIPTNTSAQLRWRGSLTVNIVRAWTQGWIDTRGRDD